MNLDRYQKQDFIHYWGNCPMKLPNGKLGFFNKAEQPVTGEFQVIGSVYYCSNEKGSSGELLIDAEKKVCKVSDIEPYYIPSGYYQLRPYRSYWISRKPERSMRKGASKDTIEAYTFAQVSGRSKELKLIPSSRGIETFDICRIYFGTINRAWSRGDDVKKLEDLMDDLSNKDKDASLAISQNVTLVSSALDIPVVLYKLNPIGYLSDQKIHLTSKKIPSKELIEEETGIKVQIYPEV